MYSSRGHFVKSSALLFVLLIVCLPRELRSQVRQVSPDWTVTDSVHAAELRSAMAARLAAGTASSSDSMTLRVLAADSIADASGHVSREAAASADSATKTDWCFTRLNVELVTQGRDGMSRESKDYAIRSAVQFAKDCVSRLYNDLRESRH